MLLSTCPHMSSPFLTLSQLLQTCFSLGRDSRLSAMKLHSFSYGPGFVCSIHGFTMFYTSILYMAFWPTSGAPAWHGIQWVHDFVFLRFAANLRSWQSVPCITVISPLLTTRYSQLVMTEVSRLAWVRKPCHGWNAPDVRGLDEKLMSGPSAPGLGNGRGTPCGSHAPQPAQQEGWQTNLKIRKNQNRKNRR